MDRDIIFRRETCSKNITFIKFDEHFSELNCIFKPTKYVLYVFIFQKK